MKRTLFPVSIAAMSLTLLAVANEPPAKPRPLIRDFVGLNTHTVQFRTDLYHPVTRLIRNYHNLDWDLGQDPASVPQFPMTRNGVNWKDLYGGWRKAGYRTEASLQFEAIDAEKWKDIPKSAFAYGQAFARYFGPSGEDLLELAEIGNEPAKYTDAQYRSMFEHMARGLRAGDPKLRIAPCAVAVGDWDKYSRDVNLLKGLEPLYDVLNVHTYAFAEHYPTWRRSHPEDPKIKYLTAVQDVIDWRNANAPGKEVWITEFGYDSTTKPNEPEGTFAKWVGVTDEEQARYIVRSYLVFSGMDVDRAYLFWFNDEDKPTLHAASGLTRNYQPKPSFHAVAHLLATLGDYRFGRAIQKPVEGAYVYEYAGKTKGDRIWAVWSATGGGTRAEVTIPAPKGKVVRAERMPLTSGKAEAVTVRTERDGRLTLPVDGAPVYVWIRR
jgi:serine/threonine-protein kinase ATR